MTTLETYKCEEGSPQKCSSMEGSLIFIATRDFAW